MKRLLSIFIILAITISLLSACVPTPGEDSETSETTTEPTQTVTDGNDDNIKRYERLNVDIGVNEDGYYGLWGDVEITYAEDGTPYGIYIENPALLYFTVSSERGGGVYILDLADGDKVIDELADIAEALKTAGLTEYAERIDAIIQIIGNSGPFTHAST